MNLGLNAVMRMASQTGRCGTGVLLNKAGEIGGRPKAQMPGNVLNRGLRFLEQMPRGVKHSFGQHRGRGAPTFRFAHAAEMGRRHTKLGGMIRRSGRAGVMRDEPRRVCPDKTARGTGGIEIPVLCQLPTKPDSNQTRICRDSIIGKGRAALLFATYRLEKSGQLGMGHHRPHTQVEYVIGKPDIRRSGQHQRLPVSLPAQFYRKQSSCGDINRVVHTDAAPHPVQNGNALSLGDPKENRGVAIVQQFQLPRATGSKLGDGEQSGSTKGRIGFEHLRKPVNCRVSSIQTLIDWVHK